MLSVDHLALRLGLDRASDLFRLHRLSGSQDAKAMAQAVFANFGLDEEKRALLVETLVEMVPVKGDPLAEWVMASSMCAGVLIGLLIADAGLPEHPATVPDCLPPNP